MGIVQLVVQVVEEDTMEEGQEVVVVIFIPVVVGPLILRIV